MRTYPNFLKAVAVTSRIKAQTASKVTNRVFQPRIHESERKKKIAEAVIFQNLEKTFYDLYTF